jgi:hypothetical protein
MKAIFMIPFAIRFILSIHFEMVEIGRRNQKFLPALFIVSFTPFLTFLSFFLFADNILG